MDVTVTATGSLDAALDDLNRALTKGQRAAATAAAATARKAILDTVKTHHGTLSMSGLNVRRLSLKTSTKATPTQATTTLTAGPAGAWAITEYGTKPHTIRARKADALTVRGAVYDEVQHPGARGFHVWDAACRAADVETGRTIEDVFDDAVAEAM